ncbi:MULTISPECIES: TetR/AcrR family transcriptional regulator [unclassified Nocardioides]|uniref:TetR/AcrR family transcriptional regulator n=1 Tax=unclassified Nocardioides TaxID=2615069 RepID=UPI0006F8EB98|nr:MULTISPECIES: TetR/AcrR family transcriptional regulator [unclassified Nocardioides]KRA29477.1 TetR family transcriptional regulator [Nocardioides sp. Root614]KRA88348.1 TetR family transcriptional regulator [Nocardioides sp. Root682]
MSSSTTTRDGRQRAAHLGPERRRPHVLDAALTIAVRDGIGAVTVGSVATAMGVTRPVVYACFADRVELVDALLDRETGALVDSIFTALHSSANADDPEQAFVDGFRALLHAATDTPDTWRLIFAGEPDPAIAERFRAGKALVQARTVEWIRPAMEHWWQTEDLDRKLPVLIDLFLATCESAVRSVLDPANDWAPDDLGAFIGKALHGVFRDA